MINEDNDDVSFLSDAKFLDNLTHRDKSMFAGEIMSAGDKLLREINEKEKREHQEKAVIIPKILKKEKKYSKAELFQYSLADIKEIYEDILKNKKSKLTKIIHFAFNLDQPISSKGL